MAKKNLIAYEGKVLLISVEYSDKTTEIQFETKKGIYDGTDLLNDIEIFRQIMRHLPKRPITVKVLKG